MEVKVIDVMELFGALNQQADNVRKGKPAEAVRLSDHIDHKATESINNTNNKKS